MNRVLETVFSSFTLHLSVPNYYLRPEVRCDERTAALQSQTLSSVYQGSEPIEDCRAILFLAPTPTPEPRLDAFGLESPCPLFDKDVQNIQPGDMVEFESAEFSTPESLSFVPQNLCAFSNKLYVQALINHGKYW
ncbi:hypothetical protein PHMEG_00034589 [Phytophthora megakarya]|uniref:Uncharacterized protein n=1 Tax=Phytophthora megakarya TaxID=4795 RepID=A0A225UR43_9STRA|nr:hypothetical protein PHMEG_00034589 [Phytophthora megakarya]